MDLTKYSDEQLDQLMKDERASVKLKDAVKAERGKRAATAEVTAAAPYNQGNTITNLPGSAFRFGTDLLGGIVHLATNNPIDTASNLLPAMGQHYKERYLTPEIGQPWYTDALNTINRDPVGALADVVPVGTAMRVGGLLGRTAGATQAGSRMSQVGRGVERLDPANLAVGSAQLGIGTLQNLTPGIRSAEQWMSGDYGQPRGAAVDDLPGYLDTIGDAMDQGIKPTVEGSLIARQAKDAAWDELSNALDNAGDISKVDLIKRLEAIKANYSTQLDGPALANIDKMIKDVFDAGDPQSHMLSAAETNALKSRYDATVNYDAGTPQADRIGQQGAKAAADVLRDTIREKPGMAGPLDAYGQASRVDDIVKRGAAKDVVESGKGLTGDIFAQILNSIAPVLTGQGKLSRTQIRRNLDQGGQALMRGDLSEGGGRLLAAADKATQRTVYGPVREGAYILEMEREYEEPEVPYRRGRLSDD